MTIRKGEVLTEEILDTINNLAEWIDARDIWREKNWNNKTDEPVNGYADWDDHVTTFNGEIAYAATLLLDALRENGIGGKA